MAPTLDSLDMLDEVLKPLVDRRLVVYLTDPDRRGAVVTHGFHTADELPRLKALHAGAPVSASAPDVPAPRPVPTPAPAPPAGPTLDARLTAAVAEIDALKARRGTGGATRRPAEAVPAAPVNIPADHHS